MIYIKLTIVKYVRAEHKSSSGRSLCFYEMCMIISLKKAHTSTHMHPQTHTHTNTHTHTHTSTHTHTHTHAPTHQTNF